MLYKKLCI